MRAWRVVKDVLTGVFLLVLLAVATNSGGVAVAVVLGMAVAYVARRVREVRARRAARTDLPTESRGLPRIR